MPATRKEFLVELFNYVENISEENKQYLINKLFKYDGNATVAAICTVVNAHLQGHKKFLELFRECNDNIAPVDKKWPLIIPSPANPLELQVYPNILLDRHDNLSEISEISYDIITTMLAKYEQAVARDPKFETAAHNWHKDNVTRYLNECISMPTARALTRYIFTPENYPVQPKDNVVRDLAEAIDAARKPAKLNFAETPEEMAFMYGSGPESCMGYTAGDKDSWKFFTERGLAPSSWYAHYPFTKGAYIMKGKVVSARAILFNKINYNRDNKYNPSDVWYFGRIYAINDEVRKQFTSALESNNIFSIPANHSPPAEFSFTIPGLVLKDKVVAPWPYFDNLSREARNWGVAFNPKTNEFTIQWQPHRLTSVNNRAGHIIGRDYISMECDSCHKKISPREAITPVENGIYVFCGHTCAFNEGYVYVLDGAGAAQYRLPQEEFVDSGDDSVIKFSTLKSATDNGYMPIMEEVGVYPEESDIKVTGQARERVVSADNVNYGIKGSGIISTKLGPFSKVPINLLPAQKMIAFDADTVVREAF